MEFTYEQVAAFAQQSGLIYFFLIFCFIIAYAVWPKNKEKFDQASRMPLEEE